MSTLRTLLLPSNTSADKMDTFVYEIETVWISAAGSNVLMFVQDMTLDSQVFVLVRDCYSELHIVFIFFLSGSVFAAAYILTHISLSTCICCVAM